MIYKKWFLSKDRVELGGDSAVELRLDRTSWVFHFINEKPSDLEGSNLMLLPLGNWTHERNLSLYKYVDYVLFNPSKFSCKTMAWRFKSHDFVNKYTMLISERDIQFGVVPKTNTWQRCGICLSLHILESSQAMVTCTKSDHRCTNSSFIRR